MKTRVLLVAFVLSAWSFLLGQSTLEILNPPGITGLPNVATANDYVSFQYNVRNIDTVPFSDTIHTTVIVNGVLQPPVDTIVISNLAPGQVQHIQVSAFRIVANPGPFNLGRNGIVIWVADDNFQPLTDSIGEDIFVVNAPAFRTLSSAVGMPQNVIQNARYDFTATVENVFGTNYNDYLFLHLEVNNQYFNWLASANKVQVPGFGVSQYDVLGFKFDGATFPLGLNHVRLWTTGMDDAMAVDTLSFDVTVSLPTGIDPSAQEFLTAYPTATQGLVHLRGDVPAGTQISLLDACGRHIAELPFASEIDVKRLGLAAGVFWLEARVPDGATQRIKLLHLP